MARFISKGNSMHKMLEFHLFVLQYYVLGDE